MSFTGIKPKGKNFNGFQTYTLSLSDLGITPPTDTAVNTVKYLTKQQRLK